MEITELAERMGLKRATLHKALRSRGDPDTPAPLPTDGIKLYYRPCDVVTWWPKRRRGGRPRNNPARRARVAWTPLIGFEVTVTPADGDPVRGVILPVDNRTPRHHLRVATTERGSQPATPGEILAVDTTTCTIQPMPDELDSDARAPSGLALYRGAVPEAALATRAELAARHGRKPRTRQRPIAQRYVDGTYVDLYAIAGTDVLTRPKAGPRHTCARCGTINRTPLPEAHFGGRYCLKPCLNDEARERWRAARRHDQAEVTAWARKVLASRRTLWIHGRDDGHTPLFVGHIRKGRMLTELPQVPTDRSPDDLAATARKLARRQLIAWDLDANAALDPLRGHERDEARDADTVAGILLGGVFGRRYAQWLGLPRHEHDDTFYPQGPELMLVTPPDTGPAQFVAALTILREMAAGDVPSPERIAAARARQAPDTGLSLIHEEAYGHPPVGRHRQPDGTDTRSPKARSEIARIMNIRPDRLRLPLTNDPCAPPSAGRDSRGAPLHRLADVLEWWPHRRRPGGDAAVPLRATADWSAQYGLLVTYRPRDPDATTDQEPFCGVVLPPMSRTPRTHLRITVTDQRSRPLVVGELTTIDPTRYIIDPAPGRSDAGAHGPTGLPVYKADVPAAALATVIDLKVLHGRRPHSHQRPVAQYFDGSFHDLYVIADAILVSPTTLAAWKAPRTCARCNTVHAEPLPQNHYDQLYCPDPCLEDEAFARWQAACEPGQLSATDWARDILASKTTMWLSSRWDTITRLFVARLRGSRVVLDEPAVSTLSDAVLGPRDPEHPDPFVRLSDARIATTLHHLAHARIIAWDRSAAAIVDQREFRRVVDDNHIRLLERDIFEWHYARWLALPYNENDFYLQPPGLMMVSSPDDAGTQFDHAFAVLREMSAGPPSEARHKQARARQAPHRVVPVRVSGVDQRAEPPAPRTRRARRLTTSGQ